MMAPTAPSADGPHPPAPLDAGALRSLLFVPADDPRKIDKAIASGADAIILDLEDSVAPARKPAARANARAALHARERGGPAFIVRVNALETGLVDDDLAGVMAGAPDGVMLPKCCGGGDVQHLSIKLAVAEAENALPDGMTRILAIGTENARSVFALGTLAGASARLAGITWGGEDLAADLGAETNRDGEGGYTAPYRLARSLALMASAAAEVAAIDSVFPDFRNETGLRAETEAARRDGFCAKMAIHPAQVPLINTIFTPAPAALARAQRIVGLFADNPDAGVLSLDGAMIDRPHLRQAERILARASAAARR